MKKVLFSIVIIISALVAFTNSNEDAHGNRSGAPSGKTGSPGDNSSCNSCHSGNPVSGSANASITSTIPSTGYVPGQTYTVTATVSGTNGRFGFEISPQNTSGTKIGTNVITDATNTQSISSGKYVTHKSAGTTGTGSRVWTFNWTAPAAGTGAFTFYGSLMAANNNNSDNGDTYYLEQLAVTEAAQINTQPVSVSGCAGGNATFTVSATGTSLTYQWKKNGVALTNNGHYSGVTTNTLTITGTTGADSDTYTVDVTGSGNTVTSTPATLTVNTAAAITTQPVSQGSCLGSNVTFTVAATGYNLSYVWKKGTTVVGTNSPTLTLTGLVAGDAGNYTCTVTGGCGSPVVSSTAVLTIISTATIAQQPTNQSICNGGTLTLNVVGTGGNNTTYQWTRNGQPVGTSSATYTVNNASSNDVGNYQVTITGNCGTVTSNTVSVTLLATTNVTTTPSNYASCAGANINLSVAATGANLTYQWYQNGNILGGATNATLPINGVNNNNSGTYTCTVTGTCGTIDAPIATLSISDPPVITGTTAPAAVCAGDNLAFDVQVTGSNLTYKWQINGVDVPNSNQTSLVTNTCQNGDIVTFVAWNNCDTVTAPFTALVNPLPNPVIVVVGGDSLTTTQPYLYYSWIYEDAVIENSNVPVIPADNVGGYTVIVMDGFGCYNQSDTLIYNPLAIIENPLEKVTVYPNPSTGDVYLNTPANMGKLSIKIISTTGQLVMDGVVENKYFNISSIPSGLYTVLLSDNKNIARIRLAKE